MKLCGSLRKSGSHIDTNTLKRPLKRAWDATGNMLGLQNSRIYFTRLQLRSGRASHGAYMSIGSLRSTAIAFHSSFHPYLKQLEQCSLTAYFKRRIRNHDLKLVIMCPTIIKRVIQNNRAVFCACCRDAPGQTCSEFNKFTDDHAFCFSSFFSKAAFDAENN